MAHFNITNLNFDLKQLSLFGNCDNCNNRNCLVNYNQDKKFLSEKDIEKYIQFTITKPYQCRNCKTICKISISKSTARVYDLQDKKITIKGSYKMIEDKDIY